MKIKFLDKFFRAMVVSIILIAPFESKAEKFDSIFWFSYGFGAGLSGTLCEQVDGGMITNVQAKMFTSNFQESLEDPENIANFDLEALVQGFNEVVPAFENCKIKLY
mgnify:CR=1 FL=1